MFLQCFGAPLVGVAWGITHGEGEQHISSALNNQTVAKGVEPSYTIRSGLVVPADKMSSQYSCVHGDGSCSIE